MDETNGLRLIEKLKEDTEKFRKEGGGYQLLEEYFHGLSKETLRDLLCYEDKYIRELTLWILSELGETTAKDFLEEAASQMNDDDPAIYYHSSEIVACFGTGVLNYESMHSLNMCRVLKMYHQGLRAASGRPV